MSIHLIDQKKAKSLSQRLDSSPFALGLCAIYITTDLSKWLNTGGYHHSSNLELAGRSLLGISVLAIFILIIHHSRKAAYLTWALYSFCFSFVAGTLVVQCTSITFSLSDIIFDLLIGSLLLLFLVQLIRQHNLNNKADADQA
nr:hypothetical protein [uncultured Holophaga sp.]